MKGVQSVTVLALVNTGSRYEKPAWGGISHFLEHMVFKGTEKYPTAQDLAAAVDAVGVDFKTAQRWIGLLENVYFAYRIPPFGSKYL